MIDLASTTSAPAAVLTGLSTELRPMNDLIPTTSATAPTATIASAGLSTATEPVIDLVAAVLSSNVAAEADKDTVSSIQQHHKRARDGLMKQAERMVKRSRVEHAAGNPGDNVTIPLPLVDRGRGDPRNIMGIILDRDDNDMYRIAVRSGILKGKYSRNQFDLCTQILLTNDDVSQDKEIALRSAVQVESKFGGQGFVKCNCSGAKRCASNRCKCFQAHVKCNSRCHTALACTNKST